MIRSITFQGSPLSLIGRKIKCGFIAPNFIITSGDLTDVQLPEFEDKIKLITTFPSLDTPVCDLQVKEFNKRASALSKDVVIIAISKDLPFAQKRFCNESNISNVLMFSDYNYSSFGFNYGLYIQELNLLARSVVILDKNNVVRYISVSDELTDSPNYDDAITKLNTVIQRPNITIDTKQSQTCTPCGCSCDKTLNNEQIIQLLSTIDSDWKLVNDTKIERVFHSNYKKAKIILNAIAHTAEIEGHHPSLILTWDTLTIRLTTHAVKGLTKNDFIFASIVDEILAY